jgi:hypothetical protein
MSRARTRFNQRDRNVERGSSHISTAKLADPHMNQRLMAGAAAIANESAVST